MSGGGSKKVTVGYWYRLLYHFGLVRGPVDAFLELRAGDRTAWSGSLTQSGRISVNQPGLWGGEESEGGLQGDLDVMFGEPSQGPNDYLAAELGSDQPTYRGKLTAVWRGGRWGAMNPYPKKAAMKVRRILKGWDNDEPWYPERAAIVLERQFMADQSILIALDVSGSMGGHRLNVAKGAIKRVLDEIDALRIASGVKVQLGLCFWSNLHWVEARDDLDSSDIATLKSIVDSVTAGGGTDFERPFIAANDFFSTSLDRKCRRLMFFVTDGEPDVYTLEAAKATGADILNQSSGEYSIANGTEVYVHAINIVLTDTSATVQVDNTPEDGVPVVSDEESDALVDAILRAVGGLIAMNAIHILYDSITASDMQGEPVGMINQESFRSAADQIFSEGFGLCMEYDGANEAVEAFQQRICDLIGASLSQSLVDGLYYVDLIRASSPDGLPIVSADDIVEFVYEPAVITEQVNQVSVRWFDPQQKQDRTTQPVQALGAIQAAGGVIPDTRDYPEIASESLALRVAERDLLAMSTPTARFRLTLNRRPFDMRLGRAFRLQYPAGGVADIICVLGDYDGGTLLDGRMRWVAVQDVFSFPDTVYVEAEPGLSPPIISTPVASLHQVLMEAPYVELVASLSRPELAAWPDDGGGILTIATRAPDGLSYSIFSAADGEDFSDSTTAEWCPSAVVVGDAGYRNTLFTLEEGVDLDSVEVGTWALWDQEICRVDALDASTGAVTLGRACADSVPARHDAGSRIFFCGDWVGTDGREYVMGDHVRARLLTRTVADILSIDSAVPLSVEINQRQFRPYPPGRVRINGVPYPSEVEGPQVTVSWAHRDRVLQSDQLVDAEMGSIGPEPGTAYVARLRSADGTVLAEDEVSGLEATLEPSILNGTVDLELLSVRDGVESYFKHLHRFQFSTEAPIDPDIGAIWTLRASPTNNWWRTVCWSPERELFVAVGQSGTGNRVMTSPNGITWTLRTSAADFNWQAVCWSPDLGLFVAVASTGSGNRVMTSPDGITWMLRASAADNAWSSICWAPEVGLFVAVASGGTSDRVMTSPDGLSWTLRAAAAATPWQGVCWAPELLRFVAVGNGDGSGDGHGVMTSA